MDQSTELILFQTGDEKVTLPVSLSKDTVWLSRNQMAVLFDRDVKTIGKHVNNAMQEELNGIPVVAKFATTAADGKTYQTEFYNLDVIISVGYRIKSKRGVEFRRWANSVLKDYIVRGYAVNNNRLQQLGEIVRLMKRTENILDTKQVLGVIERYTVALDLLDDYDHQVIKKPKGNLSSYVLSYEECYEIIGQMRFCAESNLFGNEKDESFRGSIGAIYQTFNGIELYPSVEEKAANLLYFVTKNHSFTDGNKRIAAALFLYFLDKNDLLFINDNKLIDDQTLVAVTILTAESNPKEKETIVNLIMRFLERTEIVRMSEQ